MIGTIIGDIVGQPFEFNRILEAESPAWEPLFHEKAKFTDDTVLTLATADAILENPELPVFHEKYRTWALNNPNRGYGSTFWTWAESNSGIKNKSYANGCMMRCSPIGIYYSNNLKKALEMAEESIQWTHNSPESLRGISAIVLATVMALNKCSKNKIMDAVQEQYGHRLEFTVDEVRNIWRKDNIRCNITCAQALICFLNSKDYESAIRLAVYSNGDCDTIAAISGGLAEAFYGVKSIPQRMIEEAKKRLEPEMISLINKFYQAKGELEPESEYNGFCI